MRKFKSSGVGGSLGIAAAVSLCACGGLERLPNCGAGTSYDGIACVVADASTPQSSGVDASTSDPPCLSGATDCDDNQPTRCSRGSWVRDGDACGTGEMCDRRFGCLPRCRAGDTECVDISHDRICSGTVIPGWTVRACDRSRNEVCVPSLGRCQIYEPVCMERDLTCSERGEVSECRRQANGTLAWEVGGTCSAASGSGICNVVAAGARPAGSSWRYACGTLCGGRGEACVLPHQPGTPVDGTTCAVWVCDGPCHVVPSRCDCRNNSALCQTDCQCVSGRCAGGFCAAR